MKANSQNLTIFNVCKLKRVFVGANDSSPIRYFSSFFFLLKILSNMFRVISRIFPIINYHYSSPRYLSLSFPWSILDRLIIVTFVRQSTDLLRSWCGDSIICPWSPVLCTDIGFFISLFPVNLFSHSACASRFRTGSPWSMGQHATFPPLP